MQNDKKNYHENINFHRFQVDQRNIEMKTVEDRLYRILYNTSIIMFSPSFFIVVILLGFIHRIAYSD